MKECVYGWYPPAREVLKTSQGKLAIDTHTKDYFYGTPNNRFADKNAIHTPADDLNVKWRASPQQVRKYKSWSRPPSRTSQIPDRVQSASITLEIRGQGQGQKSIRPKSCTSAEYRVDPGRIRTQGYIDTRATPDEKLFSTTPDPRLSMRTPVVKMSVPTPDIKLLAPTPPRSNYMRKSCSSQGSHRPTKAWNMKTEETNHIPDFQTYLREMSEQQQAERVSPHSASPTHSYDVRHDIISVHDQQFSKSIATPGRDDLTPASAERQDRIKSATMYRPRMCTHRSVKSASSVRRTPMVITPDEVKDDVENATDSDHEEERKDREWQLNQMVNELTRDHEAPEVGESIIMPPRANIVLPDPNEELGVENPLDYDEQLDRHGWRMQVHGDPLNLKRPCIAKRLAFTEKVPVRVIPPDPPKARSECFDTYFLNTIPRRPMTFTIHQDWASEVLHAKRMQLQKRDGDTYKYRTANFSFVY